MIDRNLQSKQMENLGQEKSIHLQESSKKFAQKIQKITYVSLKKLQYHFGIEEMNLNLKSLEEQEKMLEAAHNELDKQLELNSVVIVGKEFGLIFFKIVLLLLQQFENHKMKESLEELRCFIQGCIIIFPKYQGSFKLFAFTIYCLFEIKRKISKQTKGLEDLIENEQLKNDITQVLSSNYKQQLILQDSMFQFYRSKLACVWQLITLQRYQELEFERQYLFSSEQQEELTINSLQKQAVKRGYLATKNIIMMTLQNHSKSFKQEEKVNLMLELKTLDFSMVSNSKIHKDKNLLFIYQCMARWNIVDAIIFEGIEIGSKIEKQIKDVNQKFIKKMMVISQEFQQEAINVEQILKKIFKEEEVRINQIKNDSMQEQNPVILMGDSAKLQGQNLMTTSNEQIQEELTKVNKAIKYIEEICQNHQQSQYQILDLFSEEDKIIQLIDSQMYKNCRRQSLSLKEIYDEDEENIKTLETQRQNQSVIIHQNQNPNQDLAIEKQRTQNIKKNAIIPSNDKMQDLLIKWKKSQHEKQILKGSSITMKSEISDNDSKQMHQRIPTNLSEAETQRPLTTKNFHSISSSASQQIIHLEPSIQQQTQRTFKIDSQQEKKEKLYFAYKKQLPNNKRRLVKSTTTASTLKTNGSLEKSSSSLQKSNSRQAFQNFNQNNKQSFTPQFPSSLILQSSPYFPVSSEDKEFEKNEQYLQQQQPIEEATNQQIEQNQPIKNNFFHKSTQSWGQKAAEEGRKIYKEIVQNQKGESIKKDSFMSGSIQSHRILSQQFETEEDQIESVNLDQNHYVPGRAKKNQLQIHTDYGLMNTKESIFIFPNHVFPQSARGYFPITPNLNEKTNGANSRRTYSNSSKEPEKQQSYSQQQKQQQQFNQKSQSQKQLQYQSQTHSSSQSQLLPQSQSQLPQPQTQTQLQPQQQPQIQPQQNQKQQQSKVPILNLQNIHKQTKKIDIQSLPLTQKTHGTPNSHNQIFQSEIQSSRSQRFQNVSNHRKVFSQSGEGKTDLNYFLFSERFNKTPLYTNKSINANSNQQITPHTQTSFSTQQTIKQIAINQPGPQTSALLRQQQFDQQYSIFQNAIAVFDINNPAEKQPKSAQQILLKNAEHITKQTEKEDTENKQIQTFRQQSSIQQLPQSLLSPRDSVASENQTKQSAIVDCLSSSISQSSQSSQYSPRYQKIFEAAQNMIQEIKDPQISQLEVRLPTPSLGREEPQELLTLTSPKKRIFLRGSQSSNLSSTPSIFAHGSQISNFGKANSKKFSQQSEDYFPGQQQSVMKINLPQNLFESEQKSPSSYFVRKQTNDKQWNQSFSNLLQLSSKDKDDATDTIHTNQEERKSDSFMQFVSSPSNASPRSSQLTLIEGKSLSPNNTFVRLSQLKQSGSMKMSVKNIFQVQGTKKKEEEERIERFKRRQTSLLQFTFNKKNSQNNNEEHSEQSSIVSYSEQEASEQNTDISQQIKKILPIISRIKSENFSTQQEFSFQSDETQFSKIQFPEEQITPKAVSSNRPSRFKKQREDLILNNEKSWPVIISHTEELSPNINLLNEEESPYQNVSSKSTPFKSSFFQNQKKIINLPEFMNFSETLEKVNDSDKQVIRYGGASICRRPVQSHKYAFNNIGSKKSFSEKSTPKEQAEKQLKTDKKVKKLLSIIGKKKLTFLITLVSAIKILLRFQERRALEKRSREILSACLQTIKIINIKTQQGQLLRSLSQLKMSTPFKFMMHIPGSHLQLITVSHSFNQKLMSYGLNIKWEYQQTFIPLDLSTVQNLQFKHTTIWPQYFIVFGAYLAENKIIKNLEQFRFDIYNENQIFSLSFFQIITYKIKEFITFEDLVMIGYLQQLIEYYLRNRFYFQYELSGYRFFENGQIIQMAWLESLKSQICSLKKQLSQQIDFHYFLEPNRSHHQLGQRKQVLLKSQKLRYSISSVEDSFTFQTNYFTQRLEQIFEEYQDQLNYLLLSYKQPRHILGFLYKAGSNFIMVQIKMCLQESLSYENIKNEKFDPDQISFLIKAKNMTNPIIVVDAKEIGARDIIKSLYPLNFQRAIKLYKMFVLRQRLPKIWRKQLLILFSSLLNFTNERIERLDYQVGQSQKSFKKINTQNIIFMNILKADSGDSSYKTSAPFIASNYGEVLAEKSRYETLFVKQYIQIYETNFVQKRDKYEENDEKILIQNKQSFNLQKANKIYYKYSSPKTTEENIDQDQDISEIKETYSGVTKERIQSLGSTHKVFYLKIGRRQSLCKVYLLVNQNEEGSVYFELILKDDQRMQNSRILIKDSKRCYLLANLLNLEKDKKDEEKVLQSLKIEERNAFVKNTSKKNTDLQNKIMSCILFENKNSLGVKLKSKINSLKNDYVGLIVKDDQSILRHLIAGSTLLLQYFHLIHKAYVLKSKEFDGRCSVSAYFYSLKSLEFNQNQQMLLRLHISPYKFRMKQFNLYLCFQDLQAVDKETCNSIFEKQNNVTENLIQNFTQRIVDQLLVLRTSIGPQVHFRQIETPRPVRRVNKMLNSPYKKYGVSNRKSLFQNMNSIDNSLQVERHGSTDSAGISKPQSVDNIEQSLSGLTPRTGMGGSKNSNSVLNYFHQQYLNTQQQQPLKHQIRDKFKLDKRNLDSKSNIVDKFQSKKATEIIAKLKYFRNKCSKYRYEQNNLGDKEFSKPFLEEVLNLKRVVYQSSKILMNNFTIVTVLRDLIFDSFILQIYIPKVCRTVQSKITISKLVDCSWDFFSSVFKEKFFFFFDNTCYLSTFQDYQRFCMRCSYMEKNKQAQNRKNNSAKSSKKNQFITPQKRHQTEISKDESSLKRNNLTLKVHVPKVSTQINIKSQESIKNEEKSSPRKLNIFDETSVPLSKSFIRIKVTDEKSTTKSCVVYHLSNMKDISSLQSGDYETFVNPKGSYVPLIQNEPLFINSMKDILPKSEIFFPTSMIFQAFKKQERVMQFLKTIMRRKSVELDSKDVGSQNSSFLPQKSVENSFEKEKDIQGERPKEALYKINDQIKEYIPLLRDLENTDLNTLNQLAPSPRQLSIQLKKSKELFQAAIDASTPQKEKEKKIVRTLERKKSNSFYLSPSLNLQRNNQKNTREADKASIYPKSEMKSLFKRLVLKHRLKLIYCKNSKRIFELFRKEGARKIDKIYQFSALTEQIDAFYINHIKSERVKKLYNYIEMFIWDKIIQDYTEIQAHPFKDEVKDEKLSEKREPKKEDLDKKPTSKRSISTLGEDNLKLNHSKISDPNRSFIKSEVSSKRTILTEGKSPPKQYTNSSDMLYNTFLCIDNTVLYSLREILHTDYTRIDSNEEYQTSVFADFTKSPSQDKQIFGYYSNGKDTAEFKYQKLSNKEKAERFYFEPFISIQYTETTLHNLYIKHLNITDQTIQKMRINLREIVNLFIAEGYYKSQTSYTNSRLTYSELKQLCHFVLYKIKTNEFFDIVEIKTTARNFYFFVQVLDPVQKILLKSTLDIAKNSIKFVVSRLGENESISRVVPTHFFESYIPFFQVLYRQNQFDIALQRACTFYGSKMLLHFYMIQ